MTRNKLKEMSDHARMMTIPKKNWLSGIVENVVFDDIIHYFNKNDIEIGYVSFPNTAHEQVHFFPEGREWSIEHLKRTVKMKG